MCDILENPWVKLIFGPKFVGPKNCVSDPTPFSSVSCFLAHLYPAAAWLYRWLAFWLADYTGDWLLAGWFYEWLAGWLTGSVVACIAGWLYGSLVLQLGGCDLPTGDVVGWAPRCLYG